MLGPRLDVSETGLCRPSTVRCTEAERLRSIFRQRDRTLPGLAYQRERRLPDRAIASALHRRQSKVMERLTTTTLIVGLVLAFIIGRLLHKTPLGERRRPRHAARWRALTSDDADIWPPPVVTLNAFRRSQEQGSCHSRSMALAVDPGSERSSASRAIHQPRLNSRQTDRPWSSFKLAVTVRDHVHITVASESDRPLD